MGNDSGTLNKLFEELLNSAPAILADTVETPNSPFVNDRQQREKRFTELSLSVQELRSKCCSGFESLMRHFPDEKKHMKPLMKALSLLKDPAIFTKTILRIIGGSSWREALDISSELTSSLYVCAKSIFEQGLFEEAMNCFTFLSWFDAKQYDHWIGLGHSAYHSESYQTAIDAYAVAALCSPEASWPYIYSASCWEAIGDVEQASAALFEGLQKEQRSPQPHQELLKSLEKKLNDYKKHVAVPTT
jgi:tetratricopeptide (TPR) repeat protein